MPREILIPHSEISSPKSITPVMEAKFKEHGLDIHKNEVVNGIVEDDFKKGVRKIKVQNSKFFFIGEVPWKKT